MPDEIARQALARSLAVRLQLLSHGDLQLVDEVVIRLCQRASESPRSRVAREAIDDLIAGVETRLAEQDADRAEVREQARDEMVPRAPVDRYLKAMRDTGDALRADRERRTGDVRIGLPGDRWGGEPIAIDPPAEQARLVRGCANVAEKIGLTDNAAAMRAQADRIEAAEFAPDQHLTRVSHDSAVIALGDERERDEELEVDVELDSDPGDQDLADEWGARDVGGGA